MDVGVDAAGGDNLSLAGNDVGAAADDHAGGDAVHDVGAPGLADADDDARLDANVGLVDAGPVDYEGVGDDDVEGVGVGAAGGLAHALAQRLAAAKLALVAVRGQVGADLDPEVGAAEADEVAGGGAEHGGVGGAVHLEHVDVDRVEQGVGGVGEAGGLEGGDDGVGAGHVDGARGEPVAAADDAAAGDGDEGDRLCVAGLEAHRGAGGDVEAAAVGLGPVELELGVHLDEVVVRPDLDGAVAAAGDAEAHARAARVEDDAALDGHDGAGLPLELKLVVGRQREGLVVGDGQKAAVERAPRIAVVGGDGVVHRDEIGSHGKGALDLDLAQRAADRRQHMAPPEHGGPKRHEVGDGVVAIADELRVVRKGQQRRWVDGPLGVDWRSDPTANIRCCSPVFGQESPSLRHG